MDPSLARSGALGQRDEKGAKTRRTRSRFFSCFFFFLVYSQHCRHPSTCSPTTTHCPTRASGLVVLFSATAFNNTTEQAQHSTAQHSTNIYYYSRRALFQSIRQTRSLLLNCCSFCLSLSRVLGLHIYRTPFLWCLSSTTLLLELLLLLLLLLFLCKFCTVLTVIILLVM